MNDIEQTLIANIPSNMKTNPKFFNLLCTEIHHFFCAPGEVKIESNHDTYILQKDNLVNRQPYHNNSFYYLKFNVENQEQCQLYYGVTRKIIDEKNQRHSILNTKMIQCYQRDQKLHIDMQQQTLHDDETQEYPGFLFRYIEAGKENFVFYENGKCMKKEAYTGYATRSLPFLHQSLESSIVCDDDFYIHIDCPNYEFVNVIDDKVYIRILYDQLEGEKIFTTNQENVDDELNVLNENILVPIDIEVWNTVMGGVMKKS